METVADETIQRRETLARISELFEKLRTADPIMSASIATELANLSKQLVPHPEVADEAQVAEEAE